MISTISTVREKVPGRNDAMNVFPLKGTFKMDKEFSDIYSDGQLTQQFLSLGFTSQKGFPGW